MANFCQSIQLDNSACVVRWISVAIIVTEIKFKLIKGNHALELLRKLLCDSFLQKIGCRLTPIQYLEEEREGVDKEESVSFPRTTEPMTWSGTKRVLTDHQCSPTWNRDEIISFFSQPYYYVLAWPVFLPYSLLYFWIGRRGDGRKVNQASSKQREQDCQQFFLSSFYFSLPETKKKPPPQ